MREELFIGLMSGTSMDGVDAVLARFSGNDVEVLAYCHGPFDSALRAELFALNKPEGPNELHRAALAANGVSRAYAEVTRRVLAQLGVPASEICALGAHGQTVRHRPGEFDATGYTLQLLNPALLAELTRIDVVADLRSRDVAAGGQGAPLVPAFHQAVFAQAGREIAVLNVGGISNVSLLGADGRSSGFDCGPGNCLMDLWANEHLGKPYDAAGAWAASGAVIEPLLKQLLSEPYFSLPPPRSTGRDLFNRAWLTRYLSGTEKPVDVQATLLELTARTVVDSLPAEPQELLVCGGGALNDALMARLRALLPSTAVMPTDVRGLPAMQVEAAAFAWLAMRFMRRLPGNLPSATGATGSRLLGGLYPA
ncbi:MAG: anhydro-N-acetylmuramic acid kinase [Paucibacter sp.]|nr:anhydro-N-acetylmuramic acid kinase [Roseateles sp.]